MDAYSRLSLRLLVPEISARSSVEAMASTLARLIASRVAVTRSELVRVTGLSRTTVTGELDALQHAGVICNLGLRTTVGRGRPAEELGLAPSFGLILVADLGVNFARLSLHDLGQRRLLDRQLSLRVADGPEAVLATLVGQLRAMLERLPPPAPPPLCLVLGLPGPIDTSRGIPVKPPIMPGWDGFHVADELAAEFGCPVLCENDVNLRALGEARALAPDQSPLLYIKVSTGIGGGLVTASGKLYHGADGSAGDIGHVRAMTPNEVLCTCGNYGCIEAVASAPAILSRLQGMTAEHDKLPSTREELVAALRANERVTVGAVRDAAGQLGEIVANLVHFFNPARIVVGGGLTVASGDMLAGIRAVVYRRALPLATRNLVIGQPVLGEWSGTGGGLVIGIEHALTPEALRAALDRRTSR